MYYDADDPPPQEVGSYWWYMNRLAEEGLRWLRMCGLL